MPENGHEVSRFLAADLLENARVRASVHFVCKLCRSPRLRELYKSKKYAFDVGRCADCGFVFVLEKFSESHLRRMYSDDHDFREFAEGMASEKVCARHHRVLEQIQKILKVHPGKSEAPTRPTLLDVGAGAGSFLQAAREAGFEVHGNEFSSAAIRMAQEKYGFELSSRSIEEDPRTDFFDAVTLWGVIEHVLDPGALLHHASRLMKLGGVLYLYTPVWCLYDYVALFLTRASGGGTTRLLDRRITPAHLQLFSARVLEAAVVRAGFELISLGRVCEYNLPVTAYLESLGVSAGMRRPMARMLDRLIDARLFFRNNMQAFCRKKEA